MLTSARSFVIAATTLLAACGKGPTATPAPTPTPPQPATPAPAAPAPAPAPTPTPAPAPAPARSIAWTLEVEPAKVSLAKLPTVRLRWTATNTGSDPVDVTAEPLSFTIDGEPSMQLDHAFGNGGYADARRNLPPGERVQDERLGLEHAIEAAGKHVIVMFAGDDEAGRVLLEVTR